MADEPSDGSEKDRNAPTVRELKTPAVSSDTIPEVVGVYAPPRPLPEVTPHRTIDVRPVRLSALADPRQALTERRLVSPPRQESSRSAWWLAAGVAVAVGIGLGAWLFAARSSSSTSLVSRTGAAPPEKTLATPVSARTSLPVAVPSPPTPLGSSSPLASASKGAAPSELALPTSPPAASKAPAPRETAKKRKDPWLE